MKKSESDTILDSEATQDLEKLKQLVSKLYLHLNIEQYEIEREQTILKQLETLRSEMEPLEKVRANLNQMKDKLVYCGLK